MNLDDGHPQPAIDPSFQPTLDAILAALPDPVLVMDMDGAVRNSNPAATDWLGRPDRDLLGGRLVDLLAEPHPWRDATTGKTSPLPPSLPYRYEHALARFGDGRTLTCELNLSPLGDALVLARFLPFSAEAPEMAEALRKSEEHLHAIAENLPGALFSYIRRKDGRRSSIYRSPTLARIVGPENARRINSGELDFRELIHEEEHERLPGCFLPARSGHYRAFF